MERPRSAAPPVEETAPTPLGDAAPLRQVLEEVRAPGANRADVDLLLRRLSGPLMDGESPRERADVLLEVLTDSRLRDVSGGDGRPVRAAAMQALLGLGYPYALEVPPDVLSEFSPTDHSPHFPEGRGFLVGILLILGVALAQNVFLLDEFERPDRGIVLLIVLLLSAGSTLLPLLCALVGAVWNFRILNRVGVGLLLLVGMGWLLISVAALANGFSLAAFVVLCFCAAHLGGGVGLWYPKDPEKPSPAGEPAR